MTWSYIENPKKSSKKLKVINEFSKAVGYKNNTRISIQLQWTTWKKKKSIFTCIYNIIKKNKIVRDKFNQVGKGPVHWKIQNISDTNWWKGTLAPGLGHTLLLNVPLPRVMARFSALPIKIPMVPGTQWPPQWWRPRNSKTILKFTWDLRGSRIATAVLTKKDEVGGVTSWFQKCR